VIIAQSDFKLLLANDVFLRPIRVIFPKDEGALEAIQQSNWNVRDAGRTNLTISLDSTILFNSLTTSGLTHTMNQIYL
jgi:hypothetical protein